MKARRKIVFALALAALVFAILLAIFGSRGKTQWAVSIDSADAGFYQLHWQEPQSNPLAPRFLSTARVIGLLKIFSRTEMPSPFAGLFGTNSAVPGTVLYDPTDKREFGSAVAADERHQFEDGTVGPAVLIESTNQVKAWISRERLATAWIGK